jgi:hypothetical protein
MTRGTKSVKKSYWRASRAMQGVEFLEGVNDDDAGVADTGTQVALE